MPIRRVGYVGVPDNATPQIDQGSGRFHERPRSRSATQVGYLYASGDSLHGYMKIFDRTFDVTACYEDLGQGLEQLEVTFPPEKWLGGDNPVIIPRKGADSFSGRIYYPPGMFEDQEYDVFSFRRVRGPWQGTRNPYFRIVMQPRGRRYGR